MKPTDLQIGDYTLVKPSMMLIKIAAVHNKKVGYHAVTNKLNWVRIDLLEPIPLTQSILEVNGFKVDGYANLNLQDGKWLEYYFHEHRFSMYYEGIDEWQNHSQVRDIVHRSQPFYVHELQHCLRLCCLNELADNLKLEG